MRYTTTRLLSAVVFAAPLAFVAACGDGSKAPADTGGLSFPDALSGIDGEDPADTATLPDTAADVTAPLPDVATPGPDSETPLADAENPIPDTTTEPDDTATAPSDTSSGPSDIAVPDILIHDVGDTPVGEPIVCARTGFPALSASGNDFGDLIILEAYDADLPPFGVLGIEIYDNVMTGPGTRELLPQNYRDCKVCVRIRTGCQVGGCSDFWLAESGRLVIDTWDTHVTGYLDGVQLRKVLLDEDTFETTPIEGPGWCIDRFYFNIQVK
jgi:hypothetical protein